MTIPVPIAVALLERARALTREPGLGIYLGLQTYSSEYGFLGFAAMSSPSLRHVLNLIVKYAPIVTQAFAFSTRVSGPRAALVVDERADFGPARDIVLLSLLIGMRHMATVNLGSSSDATVVHVTFPEPAYYERFRHVRPAVRFGRRSNEVVFDAALLDAPLATADPASHRLAQEQCERIFDSIAGRSRHVAEVGRMVLRADGGQRSCEEVAALLDMSPRTLRRRLAEEKTTFLEVRDQELRDRAIILLRSKELSNRANRRAARLRERRKLPSGVPQVDRARRHALPHRGLTSPDAGGRAASRSVREVLVEARVGLVAEEEPARLAQAGRRAERRSLRDHQGDLRAAAQEVVELHDHLAPRGLRDLAAQVLGALDEHLGHARDRRGCPRAGRAPRAP